jgi:HK97 family phage major capsid protein
MKQIFKDKIDALKIQKRQEQIKVDSAKTEEELRGIVEAVKNIDAQIATLTELAEADEAEEARSASPANAEYFQTPAPADAKAVNGAVVASARSKDNESMEYRKAFMELVLRNKPIPAEFRGDANTLTTDVASVIPTVIINRIVEQVTNCGMILPLVTRTAYAAGVVVPTSATKPVASWVNEGAGSDRQKKTTGSITFSHFKLRCEISMSMEVGTMALDVFENTFVRNVSDAMVVALEKSVLAGTGSGQPTGILNGTLTSYEVTSEKTSGVTYGDLVAMEAKLPAEYEGTAKWFMTKAQYMAFVGMVDTTGQPIARVDHGIDGRPTRMLLGREVVVHPYATEMGSYLAGLYNFKDYIINTIYDLGIQRKQDWETEDYLTKAVMGVDGKPVDLGSLVVLKQKTSA